MHDSSLSLYKKLDYFVNHNLTTNTAKYCKMTISVGDHWCILSIVERNSNTTQLLAYYHLSTKNITEKILAITKIFESDSLFKLFRGKNLCICVDNDKYTVLPKTLIQPQFCEKYLEFACNTNGFQTHHHINEPSEIAVVFGVEPELAEWFGKLNFSQESTIIHQANSLIAGVEYFLEKNKLNSEPKIIVFVTENELNIIVMNKNSLIYYNRFSCADSDKAMSYIFTVMETLNLNRYIHELILLGQVTKESIFYKKSINYIKTVRLVHKKHWLFPKKHKLNNIHSTYFNACYAHLC